MRIAVEHDRCEGHGLCAAQAPEAYDLDDDGVVVPRFQGRDVPAGQEAAAAAGARVCPVAALTVTGPG